MTAFLGWHLGVPAYQRAQPVPAVSAAEDLALPAQVFDPAPHVPATDRWGPPGPVGLVFQGVRAADGFTGEVAHPWYTVSARTGEYRRLALPHLSGDTHRLSLSPHGTRIAWWSPQGLASYDTMTGRTWTFPETREAAAGPATPLVWSPDSTRIAFGRDPVHVLDVRTAHLTELPLRLPAGGGGAPAWTADGRWVSVAAGDSVEAVEVASGRRRTLTVPVGALGDPDWNRAGVLAGVHPKRFGNVVRLVRAGDLGAEGGAGPRPTVSDQRPRGVVVSGSWGWAGADELVVTGLRPQTGSLEQAVAVSARGRAARRYTQFPSDGENWVSVTTVSPAADLLSGPPQEFERPRTPWSPAAKLLLCLLVTTFPVVYYLIARRPRHR